MKWYLGLDILAHTGSSEELFCRMFLSICSMKVEEGLVKVLALFAIVGTSLGASGAMVAAAANSGSFGELAGGFAALQSIGFAFFASPIVASIAGLYSMYSFESDWDAIQVGGAGSFVGFYVMFICVFLMLSLTESGPSASFASDNLIVIGFVSLPSAGVGALVPVLS